MSEYNRVVGLTFASALFVGGVFFPLLLLGHDWLSSPGSNAFRSAIGMSQISTAKPKTIPCKTLDDKTGTKECKVRLDDGRTVTCIVDGDNKSCDWRHAE
ncbi:hypothetical protein [Bifidobacterium thermophilum]|uniref:hypothetical protein n=1 Tax=Bifidobacterium thermophilum TaxID=33905 RepID=UPI003F9094EA